MPLIHRITFEGATFPEVTNPEHKQAMVSLTMRLLSLADLIALEPSGSINILKNGQIDISSFSKELTEKIKMQVFKRY